MINNGRVVYFKAIYHIFGIKELYNDPQDNSYLKVSDDGILNHP
jgi:hypothetical protein